VNRFTVAFALCLLMNTAVTLAADEWKSIAALPDREGFAGSYAGSSHGTLLVAGGANFPDKGPAEGGVKVWYDQVFALDAVDGKWQIAGKLPRPLGYGVSISYGNAVICVGGSDASKHYADVFRLEWHAGMLLTTTLPSLPQAIANMSGALVGNVLYIVGGQATPSSTEALTTVWQIDLSSTSPRWRAAQPLPGGGRIFAVVASFDEKLWVVGGAALMQSSEGKSQRKYLIDGYFNDTTTHWHQIAELPLPVTAAASPAPSDDRGFFVLGGDDGTQVGIPATQHQGFSNQVLHYDVQKNRWTDAGRMPAPRVTLPCVNWQGVWVLPSGERLPGVRSPQVWTWTGTKQHE
jgi:N-acetylneuraminate epimerase